MKHPEVNLDAQQRLVVEEAVSETCFYRNWTLHASTARSNHVHVVLGAGNAIAETVLNALKANATRLMREQGCWPIKYSPWSTGGSTRYVWKSEELADAINYVLNCQD